MPLLARIVTSLVVSVVFSGNIAVMPSSIRAKMRKIKAIIIMIVRVMTMVFVMFFDVLLFGLSGSAVELLALLFSGLTLFILIPPHGVDSLKFKEQ